MNTEEANLILQCRRPHGQDDHDAAISEALSFAANDAGLSESLRHESALDAVIGERLRSVEPPADLRRKIHIGAKVSRVRHWWLRPAWLAVAAGVAVAFPLTLRFWPAAGPNTPVFASITLPDFRTVTTQRLNEGPDITRLATMEEVEAHLAANSKVKQLPVPDTLCHCPRGTVGCAVFEWKGREVTLICFDAGKPGVVHLFTVDASALADRPGGPLYETINGWQTCTWISGDRLMMLAGCEKNISREDLDGLRK